MGERVDKIPRRKIASGTALVNLREKSGEEKMAEREGYEVILGLGSNQGFSREILFKAVQELGVLLKDLRMSRIYLTKPRHLVEQPMYYNCAVVGFYQGSPEELLTSIQKIEERYGRDRSREQRWGARRLDIDILLMGNLIIDDGPRLQIPHPRLLERKFALLPLLELCPLCQDPRTGIPLWQIYEQLPDQGIYYTDMEYYNQPSWKNQK
ncbi:MAG TPA: 2-amino-4-hydroxy-6-hydroxymethyldihydropteridine diphosphokinase [Termitinemataceae bacterium]|nr:2-amino-4-hydroxy-6-hydroxymethyldihydropteridine diphosphokinase [Termitinemataceae bacterium]HPP99615.1 2-amino-4-hydroxy-6-hydroxymethyldihydropteridine diphosphokinase [Termitinemataceae bacterium]